VSHATIAIATLVHRLSSSLMASGAPADLALTRPVARSSRSGTPRTPSSQQAQAGYVSFPTPAQLTTEQRTRGVARSSMDASDDPAAKAKQVPANRRSLAWTLFTFVISAPSLLGMCTCAVPTQPVISIEAHLQQQR